MFSGGLSDGVIIHYAGLVPISFQAVERAMPPSVVDPTVASFEYITLREEAFLYGINVTEDRLSIVDLVQEENGVILTALGLNGQWELRIRFADNAHLTRFHNQLKEGGITPDVKRIHEFDGDNEDTELLTGPQREALEAAVEHGYFAIPRKMSLEELSDEVGRILTELRDRNPGAFDLRTVEKASYQQYRETYDVGRW